MRQRPHPEEPAPRADGLPLAEAGPRRQRVSYPPINEARDGMKTLAQHPLRVWESVLSARWTFISKYSVSVETALLMW